MAAVMVFVLDGREMVVVAGWGSFTAGTAREHALSMAFISCLLGHQAIETVIG